LPQERLVPDWMERQTVYDTLKLPEKSVRIP